jgi:two-component system, OmpR family, sensor histidine kinase VicK
LEQLTYVILDITRIESQSLKLEIATQPQRYIILNTIEDYSDQLGGNGGNLLYRPDRQTEEDIYVQADRERKNDAGRVNPAWQCIKVHREWHGDDNDAEEQRQYRRRYSAEHEHRYIDPDIMPRLFTKFATKSEKGTGLGLFISKSIVEAHGGRMWGENNKDGRGATFTTFSLSVSQ